MSEWNVVGEGDVRFIWKVDGSSKGVWVRMKMKGKEEEDFVFEGKLMFKGIEKVKEEDDE